MGTIPDENLTIFIDESLEHLSDIENELIAIERGGAEVDEDLVNKVYRAAHSIKGGAGFMGLSTIKELTHEMENILGEIRAGERLPESPVINALLRASDTLRNLINDIEHANEADISGRLEELRCVCDDAETPGECLPPEIEVDHPPVTTGVTLRFPGDDRPFHLPQEMIDNVRKEGKQLYLIALSDIGKADLLPLLQDMNTCGVVLVSRPELPPADGFEADETPPALSYQIVFATILKPADLHDLLNSESAAVYSVGDDHTVRPAGGMLDESPALTAAAAGEGVPSVSDSPFSVSPPPSPDPQPSAPASAPFSPEPPSTTTAAPSSPETPPASDAAASPPEPPAAPDPAPTEGPGTKTFTEAGWKPPSSEPAELDKVAGPVQPAPTKPKPSPGQTPAAKPPPESAPDPAAVQSSLRVAIPLLDRLMTLAGELVLSRNQLLQALLRQDRRALEISGQRIDLITSDLQQAIMNTRMQPLRTIFNKFPRVVRDLAQGLNKRIELTVEGKEVELDKSIIENLNDPMTHLIRNAADHGLESPEERIAAGKDPVGRIHLRAYHEAGQVNIEIQDDGRGIDGERIAASAVEKGLAREDRVAAMSTSDKVNLIFLPGFSMSEEITELSGRGVGMDVVKTNLDKLGGLVDIESRPGQGTTIHVKLPLTLAIIPSLLVSDANERYAIPQVNVVELLRIPPARVPERIEWIGDAPVVRLRDELLPLLRLSAILGTAPDRDGPVSIGNGSPGLNIVVVFTGIFKYGLVVDRLHDSEEIVVKPLGRHLKDCKGYAGATILGDGRVALILDVGDLAALADLASLSGSARETRSAETGPAASEESPTLLLFRNSENSRFAVPLELVERIDRIRRTDIDVAGGRRVLRRGDAVMPLFDIGEVASVAPFETEDKALVIVFFVAGMDVGLLAIPPIDTVKTRFRVDETALKQPGIAGSAVIEGKTTLMVDVIGVVEALHPEWFAVEDSPAARSETNPTVILAEDSRFFRNQMKCAIQDAGYHVLEAEDGRIAWDLLQKNGDLVSLVVTDLEMPHVDGFEFTRRIKADQRFAHLPVVAVSSLAGKADIRRAEESGVDQYQVKLDRKKLVECLNGYLREG